MKIIFYFLYRSQLQIGFAHMRLRRLYDEFDSLYIWELAKSHSLESKLSLPEALSIITGRDKDYFIFKR